MSAPTVFICAPQGFTARRVLPCRKCKRRTRHLVTSYVWYDPTFRCLAHEVRVPYSYRRSPERADAMWREAMTRAEAHTAVVAAAMADLGRTGGPAGTWESAGTLEWMDTR